MVERALEVERKFLAPPGFDPDLQGVAEVVSVATLHLDATYHDTPGLTLTSAGWLLRRRQGGRDAGWHLKRPASGEGRTEVWAEDAEVVPDELRQEVREVTGLAAIVPVARLTTTRIEWLVAVDGVPVATLAQDSVSATTASGAEPWQEIEVELEPGAPAGLLEDLTRVLLASGATPAPHTSKVARALTSAPRLVTPTSSDAPARDVMLAWASRQVGVLQALEPGVRADAPDTVHKSRVATRRFRSLLKTFARLFDAERTDPLRAELRWLGEVLGVPRDAEVLREELVKLLSGLSPDAVGYDVRGQLLGHLAHAHARAHAALVEALDSPRASALRTALVDFLVDPPLRGRASRPADAVLPKLRQRSIDQVAALRRKARKTGELERWHDVRKAAKAARYATEALADSIEGMDAEVAIWEAVTEAFGTLQDTVVATELIDEVALTSMADPSSDGWKLLHDLQQERRVTSLEEGELALARALDR